MFWSPKAVIAIKLIGQLVGIDWWIVTCSVIGMQIWLISLSSKLISEPPNRLIEFDCWSIDPLIPLIIYSVASICITTFFLNSDLDNFRLYKNYAQTFIKAAITFHCLIGNEYMYFITSVIHFLTLIYIKKIFYIYIIKVWFFLYCTICLTIVDCEK